MKPLANWQRKLVENNFYQIKETLAKKLNKRKSRVSVDEVLSYLPEVTKEYKPDKDGIGFISFAVLRCWYRYQRNQLHINGLSRLDLSNDKIIREIRNSVIKKQGYCTDDDIFDELPQWTTTKIYQLFARLNHLSLANSYDEKNIKSVKIDNIKENCNHFNQVEWEDTKSAILKNSKTYFVQNHKGHKGSLIVTIAPVLIEKYLLPKAEGSEYISVHDIAKEFGITRSRIVQIIRSPIMKQFIKKYVK